MTIAEDVDAGTTVGEERMGNKVFRAYCGRKAGKMMAFDTEEEARAYTDDSVALYEGPSNDDLHFMRVVCIKATADECAALLGGQ